MSKYPAEFLSKFFKLTSRFENPNLERAHSHLSSRVDGGLEHISIDELRTLHQIRRLSSTDDVAISFIEANVDANGVNASHLSKAKKNFGAPAEKTEDQSNKGPTCGKCGAPLRVGQTVCSKCGDKKGLQAASKPSGGAGCGTALAIVMPLAMLGVLGLGLKSCLGVFSEESREAARQERYDNCVEGARRKAEVACSIDPCDVGCKIEYMDDYLAITRCLNRCRDMTPAEQQSICKDAQSTVLWTAIEECPR